MIINLIGQPGAGKTTIAKQLTELIPDSINIDGDELREIFVNKDYSETGRRNNITNAYNIALFLECKGFTPVISLVSPYRDLREGLKDKVEVREFFIHTSSLRGRENFFVKDYEPPLERFIDIDTTSKSIEECVEIVLNEISK